MNKNSEVQSRILGSVIILFMGNIPTTYLLATQPNVFWWVCWFLGLILLAMNVYPLLKGK